MEPYLETDRLVLRRFTLDDLDLLISLDTDPEVMRYLADGKPTPVEKVRETLPRLVASYDRGYGYWAAIEKSSGEFLGWMALGPANDDEPELGYRLRPTAWGKGYATEGARALIQKGFAELGARRIFAQTMAVNAGSRRVMEKAGLRFVRSFFEDYDVKIDGAEHGEVEYALERTEWEQAHLNR